MPHRRTIRAALTVTAAALVTTAPASANVADYHAPVTRPAHPQPTVRTRVIEVSANGFDWRDATIGAAATGGLVLVAAGGFGAAHRARMRPTR